MGRKPPQRHLTLHELRRYLQPALSEKREDEVEAHLAICAACNKKAHAIRKLWAVADVLELTTKSQGKAKPAPTRERLAPKEAPQFAPERGLTRRSLSNHKTRRSLG